MDDAHQPRRDIEGIVGRIGMIPVSGQEVVVGSATMQMSNISDAISMFIHKCINSENSMM